MKKLFTFLVLLLFVTPTIQSQVTLYSCNSSNSPTSLHGVFDLTTANTAILSGASVSNFIFTYHHSNSEAQSGSNAISSPNTSHTFIENYTVYARAQSTSNSNNFSVTPITQTIVVPPNFNIAVVGQTATVTITSSGTHNYPGASLTSYRLDNYIAYVDYNTNSFNNVWTNLTPGNRSFVYLAGNTGCTYVYDFVIGNSNPPPPPPTATTFTNLIKCGSNGSAVFNLTDANSALLVGNSQQNVLITYFISESNAINNTNGFTINQATNYTSVTNNQLIWARMSNPQNSAISYGNVTLIVNNNPIFEVATSNQTATLNVSGAGNYVYKVDYGNYLTTNVFNELSAGTHTAYVKNTSTDCFSSQTFTIANTLPVLTLPQGTIYRTLSGCNVASTQVPIWYTLNLYNASNSLISSLSPNTYSSTFYNSYNQAVSQSNAIVLNGLYISQTQNEIVWERIQNTNVPSDIAVVQITLTANLSPAGNVTVNGQSATVNLTTPSNYQFALDQQPPFQNSPTFNNITPGNHYISVRDNSTLCEYVFNFVINNPAGPVLTLPQSIIQLSYSGCNLNNSQNNIVSNLYLPTASANLLASLAPNTYTSGFYLTYLDAVNQTNAIQNAYSNNYFLSQTSTIIWQRIQNTNVPQDFAYARIDLIITTAPVCNIIVTGQNATVNITNPSEYQYSLDSISNFQSSLVFNGLTSGSHNIYLKKIIGPNCFYTFNFVINLVSPTEPSFMTSCIVPKCVNGENNIGTTTHDLTTVNNYFHSAFQLSATNYSITHYSSYNDAYNNTTPINVQNHQNTIANSPFVYVRVQNNSVLSDFQIGKIGFAISIIPNFTVNYQGTTATVVINDNGITLSYSLNNSAYQSSKIFNGIAAGTYTVKVRSSIGCVYEQTVTLQNTFVPQEPTGLQSFAICNCGGAGHDGLNDSYDLAFYNSYFLGSLSPQNYSVKHYVSFNDAFLQLNQIMNPTDFRNTLPFYQKTWVRIQNNNNLAIFSFGNIHLNYVGPTIFTVNITNSVVTAIPTSTPATTSNGSSFRYSLDDFSPSPSYSNVFNNVSPGPHTMYVYSCNCATRLDFIVPAPVNGYFSNLILSPNPTTSLLNIANNFPFEQITITNTYGLNVMSYSVIGLSNLQIDVSTLSSGVYFVKVVSSTNEKVIQFIKI